MVPGIIICIILLQMNTIAIFDLIHNATDKLLCFKYR